MIYFCFSPVRGWNEVLVKAMIEKLAAIQECDCRILKFERELKDLPTRKQEIEARLEENRQALVKAREAVRLRQSEVKYAEAEVAANREKIKKHRDQQVSIKSNREFRVVDDEIAVLESGIRKSDDSSLEMMQAIEKANEEVKRLETSLLAEEDSIRAEVQGIEERAKAVAAELARVQKERQGMTVGIDANTLRKYDRIMNHRKDAALVKIVNGACSGCHMRLPPYLVHAARRSQELVSCSFCGRFIYMAAPSET